MLLEDQAVLNRVLRLPKSVQPMMLDFSQMTVRYCVSYGFEKLAIEASSAQFVSAFPAHFKQVVVSDQFQCLLNKIFV